MKNEPMLICKHHKTCNLPIKGIHSECTTLTKLKECTSKSDLFPTPRLIIPRKYTKDMLRFGMRVQLISLNSMLRKCYKTTSGTCIISEIEAVFPQSMQATIGGAIVHITGLNNKCLYVNNWCIPYSFIKYVVADE